LELNSSLFPLPLIELIEVDEAKKFGSNSFLYVSEREVGREKQILSTVKLQGLCQSEPEPTESMPKGITNSTGLREHAKGIFTLNES
jgi:hypothetical protein